MNMSRVHPGDHVEVDVRGYRFLARFEAIEPSGDPEIADRVRIQPVSHNVTFFCVTKQDLKRRIPPAKVAEWEPPGGEDVRAQFRPRGPRKISRGFCHITA